MAEQEPRQQDKEILLAAFETARAWSSLIVTLSTGAIVFTAVFRENFAPQDKPLAGAYILFVSWILLGIASILGVFFLGNLINTLNKGSVETLDVYAGTTRFLGVAHVLAFLFGLGFLLVFFALNLF